VGGGTAGVAVPEPLEQGDLDGLCGVYAVVNATRLAAHPHRRLPPRDCYELFAALLAELAGRGPAARLRDPRARRPRHGPAAAQARTLAAQRHGLALEVSRPFAKRDQPGPDECLRVLAEHLARPGTAAIVGSDEHWTVVRGVTPKRLLLADSNGRRYFATPGLSRGPAPVRRLALAPGHALLRRARRRRGAGRRPLDRQRQD
jgi:hypothetical protein